MSARTSRTRPRATMLAASALGIAVLAVAVSRVRLHPLVAALVGVRLGWLAVGSGLMAFALLLRGLSWLAVLRAALPRSRISPLVVIRATMIGVMTSSGLPGRLGEPARAVVVARHLGGMRESVSVVAGTIVSQTLLNLVALIGLGAVVIAAVGFLSAPIVVSAAVAAPAGLVALMLFGPSLLDRASRGTRRLGRLAGRLGRQLAHARSGLHVFVRVRHGIGATAAQLAAWGVQVLACDAVLRAMGLEHAAGLLGAAALLVAVNLTAVVPVTPANVGVFQATCAAVLAGFGVVSSRGLAYGIVLQAAEVLTAVALGLPALAQEGLSWARVRRTAVAAR